MFAKLLKHEWRGTAGTLGLLSLIALGMGVVGILDLRVILHIVSGPKPENSVIILLMVPMILFLFLGVIALGVYIAAVYVLLMYRFYKNKFTDEGYLTFTLPVTNHQIFLSSLVNILIWMLISALVIIAVVAMVLFFGIGPEGWLNGDLVQLLRDIFEDFFEFVWDLSPFTCIVNVLYGLVSVVASPVITMACLTVGAVVAKKHKILASIGIMYAVSSLASIVSGVLMMALLIFTMSLENPDEIQMTNLMTLIKCVMTLGLGIGSYFLATHLMKHKLNLP